MRTRNAVAVLVVEDDASLRETVVELLQGEGYHVYVAPDGPTALAYLRTTPERLVVLLDWWMPGMDGGQVLRIIAREEEHAQRHEFIVYSAALVNGLHRALTIPITLSVSLLEKGVDLDIMLRRIAAAVAHLTAP